MAQEKGQVLGVGGLFMTCRDPEATRYWYVNTLGMQPNDYGGFDFLHATSAQRFPQGARSIFGLFPADSDYLKPSKLPFMINLIVDDLDAVLARAAAAGAEELQPREDYDYGRFAWLLDPDGRKVELWEPREPS
jgi:catechol 2,3-dioxygenase-like lactoylglutathione lyase family enzyme